MQVNDEDVNVVDTVPSPKISGIVLSHPIPKTHAEKVSLGSPECTSLGQARMDQFEAGVLPPVHTSLSKTTAGPMTLGVGGCRKERRSDGHQKERVTLPLPHPLPSFGKRSLGSFSATGLVLFQLFTLTISL
ncbi:hypothetical protein TNCV_3332541 [Trichonephila clavipes]|nr:hypothetical protein TNCV_3332541 [Trichonephila clavipes]